MNSAKRTAVRGINSVDHTLRLVHHLAEVASTRGATVTEMTHALDLPRPTVYRMLATLQEHGWVVREDMKYRLTLRLLALAESAFSTATMQSACQPQLLRLSQATGETAHFAVLDGIKAGYIAKVDGAHAIRMNSYIGWRGPLHATAVGKAMLAFAEAGLIQTVLSQPLERFTDRTITDPAALKADLKQIKKQGYAIDDQELLEGLVCVAAPVVTRDRLWGAVSISGPESRRSALLTQADQVCDAARAIAAEFN